MTPICPRCVQVGSIIDEHEGVQRLKCSCCNQFWTRTMFKALCDICGSVKTHRVGESMCHECCDELTRCNERLHI